MIRNGVCELHGCRAPGGFCAACADEQESWLAAPANDDALPAHLREAAPECERVPFWWVDSIAPDVAHGST